MNTPRNHGFRTTTLIDCIAAMPSAGASRARAFMTKDENAKKTPATSPQPSAATSVKAKRSWSVVTAGPTGETRTWSAHSRLPRPPDGPLVGAVFGQYRADLVEKPARVRRVPGRRLQARDLGHPVPVELHHAHLAQVLGGHRRQGHVQVAAIGPRLEPQVHFAPQPVDGVLAQLRSLADDAHPPARERLVEQRSVKVPAAELVNRDVHRLVSRQIEHRPQQGNHAGCKHPGLDSPLI